jgi:hypothetical protein
MTKAQKLKSKWNVEVKIAKVAVPTLGFKGRNYLCFVKKLLVKIMHL